MAKPKKTKKRKTGADTVQKLRAFLENADYWEEFDREMEEAVEERAAKCKDGLLHLRINSRDLAKLKEKAAKSGMCYQTFIAEILKRAAQS